MNSRAEYSIFWTESQMALEQIFALGIDDLEKLPTITWRKVGTGFLPIEHKNKKQVDSKLKSGIQSHNRTGLARIGIEYDSN